MTVSLFTLQNDKMKDYESNLVDFLEESDGTNFTVYRYTQVLTAQNWDI